MMAITPLRLMLALILAVTLAPWQAMASDASVQDLQKLSAGSKWADALSAADQLLARDENSPQRWTILYHKGYALERLGRTREAHDTYQLIAISPEAPEPEKIRALMQLGVTRHLLQRYDQAIQAYQELEKIPSVTPDQIAEARLRTGYALGKKGDVDASHQTLLSVDGLAGAHMSSKQTALVVAGGIDQRAHRYEQAIVLYDRALAYGRDSGWGRIAANRRHECTIAQSADPTFYIQPYTSHVTDRSATVHFISRQADPSSIMTLRGGGKTLTIQGQVTKLADQTYYRHSFNAQGLTPGMRHAYDIALDGKHASGSFLTADQSHDKFRFVV